MRRTTWGLLSILLLGLLVIAPMSFAKRPATSSESRAMWRVVDKDGRCTHHRGSISTVATPGRKFGTVLVSDNTCGNGRMVLRKTAGNHPWKLLFGGSEFLASDCPRFLRKAPLAVLRDLLFPEICTPGTG